MMSYEEICEELIAKNAVKFEDVYNFTEMPLEKLFEHFFQFCQTNLSERCKEYDIQPARFIYTNSYEINARARFPEGFNIIEVNSATMIESYKQLVLENTLFEENKEINENYGEVEKLFEISMGYLMYQAAVIFTYFHELAHLIQKPLGKFSSLDEQKHDGIRDHYSMEKHCLEFDADIHAGNLVPAHVLNFWKTNPEEYQTAENVSKLLSVVVSGILNYFMIMGQCDQDIYYMAGSHPHPVIRAVYITEKIIRVAEINVDFKLDSEAILRESFNITEKFCEHHNLPNFATQFNKIFRQHRTEISRYIEVLDTESDQFPKLVRNRFPDNE